MKTNNNFDPRQFRNALGSFATGVTIITAKDLNGGFVGTTASSFNTVSMDPPLILWSIDKGARALESYEKAESFCVNVLAADQIELSNRFARQQQDKFSGIDYELGQSGVPVLEGCAASFQCKTHAIYEGGDHLIILGEVVDFTASDRPGLIFHAGSYAVSNEHPQLDVVA